MRASTRSGRQFEIVYEFVVRFRAQVCLEDHWRRGPRLVVQWWRRLAARRQRARWCLQLLTLTRPQQLQVFPCLQPWLPGGLEGLPGGSRCEQGAWVPGA